MITFLIIAAVIVGIQAIIGGIVWLLCQDEYESHTWNLRQTVYMVCLHGIFVILGMLILMVHTCIFEKLGQPTKFEKAYKNITQ